MSRSFIGIFDPRVRIDVSRLHRALGADSTQVIDQGAVKLACSGAPIDPSEVVCMLDGQLDNAPELRCQLDRDAAERAPRPDSTEQLLAACWQRWGRALLPRMRGEFVLLIWDRTRREGLLARDQLGVRPGFVYETAGSVYFAGEIRDVLALLPTRPPPDTAGLAHWLGVSPRPGFGTLYEGIERLPPGTALLLDRSGARRWRYWSARYREPLQVSEEELASRVRNELERSVRRRLAPSGASGVLMSGGLDSSAIAAIAAEQAGAGVQAYSAVFPEHPDADESALIAELSERLALPSVRAAVRPGGLLASAIESVAAWQMPLLGWGDFWTLPLLRAAAAEGVESMLDGDGGDELFGVRSYVLADRLRSGHPLQALELARRLPGAAQRPPLRQVAAMLASQALLGALPYRLHRPLQGRSASRRLASWLGPELRQELLRSEDPLAWKRLDGPRWWAHAAHGVSVGIEQAGIFEHQRRRAALAGLEARHPLLDFDLVELCLRQPPLSTLDPRRNRPVLRAATSGLLPDSVRLRPAKARFESLIVDGLRGPDAAAVRRLLSGPDAQLGAYVDLPTMRESLLDSNREIEQNPLRWMWQLWRLINAECWLRAQDGSLDQIAASAGHADVRIDVPLATASRSR